MPPEKPNDKTQVESSESQQESGNPTPPAVTQPTSPVNDPRADQLPPGQNTPAVAPRSDPHVTPAAPAPKAEKPKGMDKFLSLTGIKKEDLMSYNPNTLTGVSSQGGKYQMNNKGTQIRHLSGPRPPSVTEAEDEAARQDEIERRENARADRGE